MHTVKIFDLAFDEEEPSSKESVAASFSSFKLPPLTFKFMYFKNDAQQAWINQEKNN